MVGRFIGAYLLRVFSPGKILSTVACAVAALLVIAANISGAVSGRSLLAIGLFNSIMLPTLLSPAGEGLGDRAAEGSGIICVAIVGGTVGPLSTGYGPDVLGLKPRSWSRGSVTAASPVSGSTPAVPGATRSDRRL
ncbi:MAG TPA: hypothetical protein VGI91_09185 [Steroidobacteraceae bacterium]|jgi:FHS family L-fucose permease-like MFS transporter